MESKKHIDLIDILKGVAIISVLICHSVIVYPVNLENVAWSNALKTFVGSYQMPLFFMISGFLCSYKGNYGGYLLSRVKRILIPYAVFNTVALFLRVVGGSLVNRKMDFKSALFQFFFQGTSSGGYWFLYALFIISAIAPLFSIILKKNRLLGLPFITVCVVVSALFDLPEICCLKSVVYYLTYFIAGMMLKGCDFEKIKDKRIAILTVSAAVFCLSFIPLRIYADNVYSVAGIYISAFAASAFFASFFSLVKMPKFIKNQLMTSGKYSLQYYLLNAFLVTGLRWLVVTKAHITTPALIVLILFAGSYIVSYLVSKYILDSNNFFRFLCGLKVQKNK